MKLGICYNLFDGYELLEYSLENSWKYADYCCVVVQELSNTGRRIDTGALRKTLNRLAGRIDHVKYYSPKLSLDPVRNEVIKRNIGLELCRSAGCTHFITSDVDEFYDPDQVARAKFIIEREGFDACACQMLEYYGDTSHCFKTDDSFYVSFIFKVSDRNFVFAAPFPVNIDPTRRIESFKVKIFRRDELQLHHLTYVRRSLYDKFMNSSNLRVKNERNIRMVDDYYQSWDESKEAMVNEDPPCLIGLDTVDFDFLPNISRSRL